MAVACFSAGPISRATREASPNVRSSARFTAGPVFLALFLDTQCRFLTYRITAKTPQHQRWNISWQDQAMIRQDWDTASLPLLSKLALTGHGEAEPRKTRT